ncbi:MAG: SCO family protein [Gammaproteobacteria bacterium]
MNSPPRSKHALLLVVVALISISAGLWLSQSTSSSKRLPPDLEATFLPKGKPLAEFHLSDHEQQPFDLARFHGKWSFLFFGYVNCPDVCPMGLQVMQSVWQQLPPPLREQSQMVFVSVDPQRDTPALLKSYVEYFHPEFLGVTGELGQIDILTRSIGILYGYDDPEPGSTEYAVNHSAQIILIDPDARMRAVFSSPHEAGKISSTFQKIAAFLAH